MCTVSVVADNCTDGTAELARQFEGICVYERNDAFIAGKRIITELILAE